MAYLDAGQPGLAIAPLERVVLSDPQHAAARIDLALAYYRSGDAAQAEQLLHDVLNRYAITPAQRQRLDALLADMARQNPKQAQRWQRRLSLAFGHTSNANEASASAFLPLTPAGLGLIFVPINPAQQAQDDVFVQGSLLLQRTHTTRLAAQRLQYAAVDARVYGSTHDYSSSQAQWGEQWQPLVSERGWRWGYRLSHARLGSESLVSEAGGQLAWQAPLHTCLAHTGPELAHRWDHRAGFGRAWVWGWQASASCNTRWAQVGLSLRWQKDDNQGQRPGGDSTRWEWQLPARVPLAERWQAQVVLAESRSQDARGYSPLIAFNQTRDGRRRLLQVAVDYAWQPRSALSLSYEDLAENNDLSLFSQQSRTLSLRSVWDF